MFECTKENVIAEIEKGNFSILTDGNCDWLSKDFAPEILKKLANTIWVDNEYPPDELGEANPKNTKLSNGCKSTLEKLLEQNLENGNFKEIFDYNKFKK
jgi:hypothetical protein